MIRQAIACDDPVIFFEPKRRYWEKGEIAARRAPAVQLPGAAAGQHGDAGLATGRWCGRAWTPRPRPQDDGHDLEVIDLRTLSPLDLAPLFDAVRRTGRLVVVSEAPSEVSVGGRGRRAVRRRLPLAGGAGAAGHRLRHAVPAAALEDDYLPDPDRVLDAVDRSLAW